MGELEQWAMNNGQLTIDSGQRTAKAGNTGDAASVPAVNCPLSIVHSFPGCVGKSGPANHRYRPIGSLQIVTHGSKGSSHRHVYVKVSDGSGYNKRWRMLSVVVWERANGPVPPGHVLWFVNRNSLDCRLENLELITKAESLRRNVAANRDKCVAIWTRQCKKRQPLAVEARRVNAARRRREKQQNERSTTEVTENAEVNHGR